MAFGATYEIRGDRVQLLNLWVGVGAGFQRLERVRLDGGHALLQVARLPSASGGLALVPRFAGARPRFPLGGDQVLWTVWTLWTGF
jgi:hypothetical protein